MPSAQPEPAAGDDVQRLAINIVRYALACHASAKPIRRDNIRSQIAAGVSPRTLKTALDRANEMLSQDFGLTMCVLPAHEKVLAYSDTSTTGHTDNHHSGTTASNGSATAAKNTAAQSKWVLQSILPDECRKVLELELNRPEQELLGFAAMVLSLIFVSNMSVPVDQLVMYVRKLGPPDSLLLSAESRDSNGNSGSTMSHAQMESAAREAIGLLVRRGYLDRVSTGVSAAGNSLVAESQATQAATQQIADSNDASADTGMEYTWGPTAKTMFQPMDMVRFIAEMSGQECTDDLVKTVSRAYGKHITSLQTTRTEAPEQPVVDLQSL
ncbi:hypothetical protein GGI07_005349 [Coemansia sp. Benny D115]|nr:hypothetical protein GGI07_005349 [Coemansia sp. Benny D115]